MCHCYSLSCIIFDDARAHGDFCTFKFDDAHVHCPKSPSELMMHACSGLVSLLLKILWLAGVGVFTDRNIRATLFYFKVFVDGLSVCGNFDGVFSAMQLIFRNGEQGLAG